MQEAYPSGPATRAGSVGAAPHLHRRRGGRRPQRHSAVALPWMML